MRRAGIGRWGKRLGVTALSMAAGVAAVEGIAAVRVRHLRAERAPLDGRLYTEIRGQGDPIVFLAGLPGTTSYWGDAFDPLARDHRLIFADALGFGHSPWPDAEYTLDEHLGALRRTLVALGATRRVTIVGHSFGTLLAVQYAARFPGEIERLYLLGTPVFHDRKEALARIREMSSTAGLFSLNPVIARESCKLHEAFGPLLAKILPPLTPRLPARIVRGAMLHTWQAFHGTLRNVVLDRPIRTPLAGIGPKVTFIHGRADGITPLARVRALAAEDGARVVVTGDEHLSYSFRDPGAIVREIQAASPSLSSD